MKKKILLCLLAVIFAVNTVTVFAESAEITASVTNVGRYVSITGNITSGAGKNISIEVLDPVQNYAYVNQIKSGADGNFSISFMLKESAVHGLYFVFVGGERVQSPASDIFSYMGEETPEPEPEPEPEPGDELITAEATNAGRYVSITGNITSGAGKNISIEVRDPVQNYAYVNQIRSGADGNFSISFMLKESAVHGLYFVFVGGEGVQSPASDIFSYMGEETPEPEPDPEPGEDIDVENAVVIKANAVVYGFITENAVNKYAVDLKANTQYQFYLSDNLTYTVYKQNNDEYQKTTITDGALLPDTDGRYYIFVDTESVSENDAGEEIPRYTLIVKEAGNDYINSNFYIAPIINEPIDGAHWYFPTDSRISYSDGQKMVTEYEETQFIANHLFAVKVSDYIYFSNMYDNGKIYRIDINASSSELVCEDSAAWLFEFDGYLYYKNVSDGGRLYRVLIADGIQTGEPVEEGE